MKHEKYNVTIGHNIKMLRVKNGLGYPDMINILSMSAPTYWRLEKGLKSLSLEEAVNLCAFYDCGLSEILNHPRINSDKKIAELEIKFNKAQETIIELQTKLLNNGS
ncbi:helix-turn-helix transcriptional regulator [uncultured Clostridium sp.]|uniref:helix-turn-helix transcriptional regulator n=1 Tax=uncultured Clostridium sp. TaxID=59620 RepID=UPI00260E0B79|nr:helix-turn-helix transcriptional regulator [uncultured Clostridium sp.]